MTRLSSPLSGALVAAALIAAATDRADAQTAGLFPPLLALTSIEPPAPEPAPFDAVAIPAPEDDAAALAPELQRRIVDYSTHERPGTIIVDTAHTHLYLVLGNGRAMRYGIGVGREGFTWSGISSVARKTEWPDWVPPQEMIARQPYLPRWVAGGPGNPLGARALYLGSTMYRIHGTNDPSTIGKRVSSGCIRLTNEDISDLYERVELNAKVVVLPAGPSVARAKPRTLPVQAAARQPAPLTGLY